MFMRVLISFLLLPVISSATAAQDNSEPTKNELIQRFAVLTRTNKLDVKIELSFDQVNDEMKALIDEDKELDGQKKADLQEERKKIFDRLVRTAEGELNSDQTLSKLGYETVISTFDKEFSYAELVELIRFYETALGQKAVGFLGTVTDEISKAFRRQLEEKIKAISEPLIDASMKELRERIGEVKKK
ncbi:MAG: hypothetical protein KF881_05920 [Acidobacteria bacterium]|nr:hypothetical protein [Acidobacteriota bacterium]